MRKVSISEAKNGLSSLLKEVKNGEPILICDRGRPVAQLSIVINSQMDGERLAELERCGVIRRGKGGKLPRDFFAKKLPVLKGNKTTTELIREDRDAGW